MEMGEVISQASAHDPEKCPFCPATKDEDFVSHPGAKATGTVLGKIMVAPDELPSQQGGARPKDGGEQRQAKSKAQPRPSPPLSHPEFGPYSYEAHHLIPGKQRLLKSEGDAKVMDGHSIERWIRKGKAIKKDTGYSINNSDNGAWLASAPENVKKLRGRTPERPWERDAHPSPHPDALTQLEKNEIADFAMKTEGQFHYGKHAITDEEGSAESYPNVVSKRLTELDNRIVAWSKVCSLCEAKPSKPPYDPAWRVNEMLDLISGWIRNEIQLSSPASWTYFISAHAMRRSQALKSKKIRSL
ncbi:AHH domain-containing protein [Myxococcus qinghaiensis]|uniref:AHH domain-containing protein n=1 Tax=Myxococcus qinghaiensis TaxID=2906758 RepID=UPI0020A79E4A|nr:AHH domain-containing protein [Myxococcus qinghaiensis]MCP3168088.1 AHH domain-containing protein [Myxococcus qinghaiensis]